MGGINLSVHPLFFAFGVYYALTGRIFIFVIYTLCAIIHELGHSMAAASSGYKLNKITLMPFGAVVSGNIDGLNIKDQIKIAIAGPITNLAIGLLFVASWWIYPQSYAFTDVAAQANFSMALVNFIPVYPLDGGRVLSALLCGAFGRDKARIIEKVTGAILSVLLLICFALTAFYEINFSLLFFSAFVLFGAFGRGKENRYVRLYYSLDKERIERGVEIKHFAVHKTTTIKRLMSIIDQTAVNQADVFDGERVVAHLTQAKINQIIESGDLYAPIEKYVTLRA